MTLGGLTAQGFVAPTVQQIVDDINAQILGTIDAGLNLSPTQPLGQIIGIFASKLAEQWELMATVFNQLNPDAAEAQLLDNICALTGVRRRSATYSLVTCTLNLNSFTTVAAGSVINVNSQPANRWILLADVANTTGSTGNFSGSFRSEQPGPFVANAGTLNQIATPVIGWNTVTNVADAVEGIPEDSDSVLRKRRQDELAASGSCTVDAIRADVLAVTGVLQCFVYENTSALPDSTGLPGHAIRVVVWDGVGQDADDVELVQAIWSSKPSGIQSYGATSANATDSQRNARVVHFDRAIQVPIYFSFDTTPGIIQPSQTQAIKDAVKAKADAVLNLGVPVVALVYQAAALTAGVTDVPNVYLGTAPSPALSVNIPITGLQIATVDTTNILVNGL